MKSVQDIELQLDQEQRNIKFDIRELTVEYYVDKYKSGRIFIPSYQRLFVWDESRQSKFIESLLIGLPIPMIFVAVDKDSKWELVDGSQRVRTLDAFLDDAFKLQNLNVLTNLNGLSYSELPCACQLALRDASMRAIVMGKQMSEDAKKDMFSRINTSAQLLLPMEIRRGVYRGEFLDFVIRLAESSLFKKLCKLDGYAKDRREEEEMVLRFFAFSETYPHFKVGKYKLEEVGVAKFLDMYLETKNKQASQEDMREKENYFMQMLRFINKNFPEQGFSKTRNVPGVSKIYFEAMSIGAYLALQQNPNLRPQNLDWADANAKSTTNFAKMINIRYRTHTTTKLLDRINYVKSQFCAE